MDLLQEEDTDLPPGGRGRRGGDVEGRSVSVRACARACVRVCACVREKVSGRAVHAHSGYARLMQRPVLAPTHHAPLRGSRPGVF